jgi:MFS transporter, DHA1 family, inner membrane transport protein
MSHAPVSTLPPKQERRLLYTLAAVQFVHIMDFMIMMPLGARLMDFFQITPAQFTWLVASYALAAAITGFAAGFVLDRFDRKRALLWLFAGFGVATLGCALAPNFSLLLIARFAAGAFGGVAGSVVTAMVGDVVPPERRGRAMATVMSAFPLASVLGVPAGLILASWFEWHAPFFLLAAMSAVIWVLAERILPHVASHRTEEHPFQQMMGILGHRVHQRALVLGAMLVFAGGAVLPFMAPSLEMNAGIPQKQIFWVYMAGGACTFFTMPMMGRLSDRHDKLHVLAWATAVAAVTVVIVTNLPRVSLPIALTASTLFFVGMSGRFAPTMAMITNAVDARYRGGFMSVNASLQQAASGLANLVAGLLVTTDAEGHLQGYPKAGVVSLVAFALTVWLAARLRAIAPHAALNPTPTRVPAAAPPAAGPASPSTVARK